MNGYGDPLYTRSLSHAGHPIALACAGGYLLCRPISAGLVDAMGTYPFLVCDDWAALAADFESLPGNLVSVVAVPDPLGRHTIADLEAAFSDRLAPYKTHYLVDLRASPSALGRHHRKNVQHARQRVEVERIAEPAVERAAWSRLYANLIDRHSITGIADFPNAALAKQLAVAGLSLFCARQNGDAVGMAVFYANGEDVYYHLGAYDGAGYAAKASYALFDEAIAWFRSQGFRRLLLGSGAGTSSDGTDGLSRFKRGWATGTVVAYLGGRILDRAAYQALSAGHQGDYFPIYRTPQFGRAREDQIGHA